MAANPPRGLDIVEPQVALRFANDPHFTWHWRALVARLDAEGTWVGFTPDLEAEVIDLRAQGWFLLRGTPRLRRG